MGSVWTLVGQPHKEQELRAGRNLLSIVLSLAVVAPALVAGSPASSAPARLDCKVTKRPTAPSATQTKKFRFCSGKVLSFDGAARLDVDVTLPLKGTGPFPLIVFHAGLGGSKRSYESTTVAGEGAQYHFNNLWFASKGYMVLNYTNRGWKSTDSETGQVLSESTCAKQSREPESIDAKPESLYPEATDFSPACYPQIAHIAYEVRDTQYLVGRMVDGTLVELTGVKAKPRKVGAIGVSYGGGQTWLLTRKNQWKSPKGTTIRLAAAAPLIAWTDLVEALLPNGRASDTGSLPTLQNRKQEPVGVKNWYVDVFFKATQFRSTDTTVADYLTEWKGAIDAGEPYSGGTDRRQALVNDALHKLLTRRSAYFVPKKGTFNTAILPVQGFTDGLFPAAQALRMYRKLRQGKPGYPVRMYLGDWGHPPAQNKDSEFRYIARIVNEWLGYYLKGRGKKPAKVVEARTTVCDGAGGPPGKLYRSKTWGGLTSGDAVVMGAGPGSVSTPTEEDANRDLIVPIDDPTSGDTNGVPDNSCRTSFSTSTPTENWSTQGLVVADQTLLGLPTVEISSVDPSADDMYIAARLWDVDPDVGGNKAAQTLVTRGVYRLGDDAIVTNVEFKLFGAAYTFAQGHDIKLELTADDSPSFRRYSGSSGAQTIGFASVELRLPLADCTDAVVNPCPPPTP